MHVGVETGSTVVGQISGPYDSYGRAKKTHLLLVFYGIITLN